MRRTQARVVRSKVVTKLPDRVAHQLSPTST